MSKTTAARQSYLCYISGGADHWQAICVDFDISVDGTSIDDVRSRISEAVHGFIAAARQEAPADRDRLLARRAPWSVRARLRLTLIYQAIFGHPDHHEAHFTLPCPA